MIDPNDPCEARAHELVAALHERGVACRLHWDRSPWGAQIYLTDHHDERAPSLFMLTEGERDNVGGKYRAFVWRGQLGNFETEMYDSIIEMIERPWLGHGVAEIADELVPFVKVLRNGALAERHHVIRLCYDAWDSMASILDKAICAYKLVVRIENQKYEFRAFDWNANVVYAEKLTDDLEPTGMIVKLGSDDLLALKIC